MMSPLTQYTQVFCCRPGGSLDVERASDSGEGAGSCLSYNYHLNLSIAQQRQRLPIFQVCMVGVWLEAWPGM